MADGQHQMASWRRVRVHFRARAGLTLLELMIVTAIISILAMAAVGPVQRARHRAMLASARVELTQLLRAAEMYNALHNALPQSFQDLAELDYTMSDDLELCHFERTGGVNGSTAQLRIDIKHRGTSTGLTATHASEQSTITELELPACADVRTGGAGGKGKGKGKGKGNQ
ncbi:MAG TPA: type II secretion system protein [Longimicrobiales bacterium]|nr:type II secretion system protein [Longimicrobiales bacterium]